MFSLQSSVAAAECAKCVSNCTEPAADQAKRLAVLHCWRIALANRRHTIANPQTSSNSTALDCLSVLPNMIVPARLSGPPTHFILARGGHDPSSTDARLRVAACPWISVWTAAYAISHWQRRGGRSHPRNPQVSFTTESILVLKCSHPPAYLELFFSFFSPQPNKPI